MQIPHVLTTKKWYNYQKKGRGRQEDAKSGMRAEGLIYSSLGGGGQIKASKADKSNNRRMTIFARTQVNSKRVIILTIK